eukprot:COSAG01_NODE_2974_length_6772_cov_6.475948_2_plen_98_part_00
MQQSQQQAANSQQPTANSSLKAVQATIIWLACLLLSRLLRQSTEMSSVVMLHVRFSAVRQRMVLIISEMPSETRASAGCFAPRRRAANGPVPGCHTC